MKRDFKVIAFDADDTLWENESFFRQNEEEFCQLLSSYSSSEETMKKLLATEIQNLSEYGYGTKSFVLSMIETALKITDNRIPQSTIEKIIRLGKKQINEAVELYDGVIDTLQYLKQKGYKLIVATKGDLLDQERKLEKYFHHVEVMTEKKAKDYQKLLSHLDLKAVDFLMIGNSYKSDIEPVLELGGFAIHIPSEIIWEYEKAIEKAEHPNWIKLNSIIEIKHIL